MRSIINILIIINIVLCIYYIYKSINNKKIEINYTILFGGGFIFYWILPIFVGNNEIFSNQKSMLFWFEIYKNIEVKYIVIYLINTAIFLCAFNLGKKYFKRKNNKIVKVNSENINELNLGYLNIIYGITMVPIIYYVYQFRNAFFKGYQTDISLTLSKGTFVAISLVLLAISVIYIIYTKKMNSESKYSKIILNKFTITYFIIATLILSLGGRMYILGSIIIYIVIYTKYFEKFKLKRVVAICLIGIISTGVIGIIRQGNLNINIQEILLNVCLESLYTFYSGLAFLYHGFNELIKFPIYFCSDFINLIPSAILPNKIEYLLQPTYIFNPQGALSSYVSFMMNFGVIGTGGILFLVGYGLEYLRNKKDNIILSVWYVMICGWIPFTFFRDEFFVSIIKNIFQFSIIVPLIIWGIVYLLTKKRYKNILRKIREKRG